MRAGKYRLQVADEEARNLGANDAYTQSREHVNMESAVYRLKFIHHFSDSRNCTTFHWEDGTMLSHSFFNVSDATESMCYLAESSTQHKTLVRYNLRTANYSHVTK